MERRRDAEETDTATPERLPQTASYRDAARVAFEGPAGIEPLRPAFSEIRKSNAALAPFATLEEMFAFLRDRRNSSRGAASPILLALLEAHQGRGIRGAGLILVRAMRPMIESLCSALSAGVDADDADRIAGDVYGAFLDAIDNYPVLRRRLHVASNLSFLTLRAYLDTSDAREIRIRNALNLFVLPLLGSANYEDGPDDSVGLLEFAKPEKAKPESPPATANDLTEARAVTRNWVELGRIRAADAELLVQAYAAGRSVEDLAREYGLKPNSVHVRLKRLRERLVRARDDNDV